MCELQRLRSDHLGAAFAFELANRTYFTGFIDDRGDEFYERYAERHRELLADQDRGTSIFHLLVDQNGAIIGRFKMFGESSAEEPRGGEIARTPKKKTPP